MLGRLSLLWKILLSTSVAITILLVLTGWFVQDQVLRSMSENLQNEIRGSFRGYESLWQARAGTLRSVSLVLEQHVGRGVGRVPDQRPVDHPGYGG